MKRKFALGLIPVMMLLLTACSTPSAPAQNTPDTTETEKTLAGYTLEEIAGHASKEDCWMAIGGKVYDVTAVYPRHPGGDAMLMGCGKDATELFANRPGDKGAHLEKTYEGLANFLIGEVKV